MKSKSLFCKHFSQNYFDARQSERQESPLKNTSAIKDAQDLIDSQFDDADVELSEQQFLSACKEMILNVEVEEKQESDEEEHTFSRDNQSSAKHLAVMSRHDSGVDAAAAMVQKSSQALYDNGFDMNALVNELSQEDQQEERPGDVAHLESDSEDGSQHSVSEYLVSDQSCIINRSAPLVFHQEADDKKQAEVIEASLSDLDDSSFLNGSDFDSKESPSSSPQPKKQS